jgi:hypothetical protein
MSMRFYSFRNRTHHQFASAIYYDRDAREWRWYKLANLPLPDDLRYRNPAGERAYDRVAAERSLEYVLRHMERAVQRVST